MKHVLTALFAVALLMASAPTAMSREVPRVGVKIPIRIGAPEETGPLSLAMVLAAYGADSTLCQRTHEAFDAKTKSTSIEALHATANTLGYSARIAQPGLDSLLILLGQGIAPILCIEPTAGSQGKQRFLVISDSDTRGRRYLTLDGRAKPRLLYAAVIASVWNVAEGRALIVTPHHK